MSDTDNNKKNDADSNADSFPFLTKIEGYVVNIFSAIKEFLKNRDAENKDLRNTIKDISAKTDKTTTQIDEIHAYIKGKLIENERELTDYKEKLKKQEENYNIDIVIRLFFKDINKILEVINWELRQKKNEENNSLLMTLQDIQDDLLKTLSENGIKKIELKKGAEFNEKIKREHLPDIIIEHTETQDKTLDCTINFVRKQGYYIKSDCGKKQIEKAVVNIYKFTESDSDLEQTSIDEKNDATATNNDDQNKEQGETHD